MYKFDIFQKGLDKFDRCCWGCYFWFFSLILEKGKTELNASKADKILNENWLLTYVILTGKITQR